jgi:hypothetical protein
MPTDRETTIEKLWQNSGHGTRWADVAAAYDAGVNAVRERWEPVSWQQRYLCPDEGPSIWQHCNDSDAALFAKRADYELRRVYALRA